jgi:predicted O-methyltransferase YrrM
MLRRLREIAEDAIGFMPAEEGEALFEAGRKAAPLGPLLEIGSYCGKSSVYLGAAAEEAGSVLFTIDHHRGSEEHQPGEEFHDRRLVDEEGRTDTLPEFRRTVARAGLEGTVIALIGNSSTVAEHWATPLALVFIDGGHSSEAARQDLHGWAPHVMERGLLVIHDVFPDPADGGRPPFEIYSEALASGKFVEDAATGSLRVLRKVVPLEETTRRPVAE